MENLSIIELTHPVRIKGSFSELFRTWGSLHDRRRKIIIPMTGHLEDLLPVVTEEQELLVEEEDAAPGDETASDLEFRSRLQG